MKKKYKLNERGQIMLWFILTSIIVIGATLLYTERIKDIEENKIILVNDSECDK